MARRAVAKKITRKQARSYRRTVPNPMGVTAIAAVNPGGGYDGRYEATRQLLGKPAPAPNKRKRAAKRSTKKGQQRMRANKLSKTAYMKRLPGNMSPAQKEGLWKGYAKTTKQPVGKKKKKKKATTRGTGYGRKATKSEQSAELREYKKAQAKEKKRLAAKKRRAAAKKKKPTKRRKPARKAAPKRRRKAAPKKKAKRPTKAAFIARQMRGGRGRKKRTQKQAAAAWRLAHGRHMGPTRGKRQKRTYGKGKYKALRARIGPKTRTTYMYKTKKGHVRKIPRHAYLGFKSSTEMRRYHDKHPRRAARDEEKWDRAERRRAQQSIRAVEGKSPFTPNQSRRRPASRTITFEEWEQEMRTNRRRKTRKKKKARRNGQTAKQKAASKRNLKKARAARKRGASPNRKRRRATTNRKRRPAKRRATSNRKRRAAPNRKRRTAKKRRVRRNRKRGFIFLRNQANGFMKNFMEVLRVGGAVTVGFVAQKAMTHLLADTGILDKLPGADNYKNTYAGLLTAALGVPIFAKVAPGESKLIGSGIGAGFLHTALVDMLNAFGQGDIADYLGNYANAEGNPQYSGYGSYYEFAPHQVYSGTGEYYETGGGMSGFGQMSANQLTQAAAGYGASPQIYQAAAAYPGVPQLYQDAAGMGAAPVLTQAAAGVGEYIVNGGKGIGEYEEVVPQYSAPTHTDEGISPDLTSAERALSVAEAAAGVGAFGDNQVPLQSTVYPTGSPEAIPDMPGGSRAGTFAGNNGVFGPTQ